MAKGLALPQQQAELWVKTRLYREGPFFCATAYLSLGGQVETFTAKVDGRKVVKFLRRHPKLVEMLSPGPKHDTVSGFPGGLFKAVKKFANDKVVKAVAKGVKAVVRSKITAGLVAAVAVVYPPVGAAAGAALAAANFAYDRIDDAERIKKGLQKTFPHLEKAIANLDHPGKALGMMVKDLPQAAGAALAASTKLDLGPELAQVASVINANPKIKETLALSAKAKGQVQKLVTAAKSGNAEAQAGVKILQIAQNTKNAIKTGKTEIKPNQQPGAFKAVLIDRRGTIVPGNYLDQSGKGKANGAIILRGKKVYQGSFNKIGCYPANGEIGLIPTR